MGGRGSILKLMVCVNAVIEGPWGPAVFVLTADGAFLFKWRSGFLGLHFRETIP